MLEGGVHGSVSGLSKTYRTERSHEGIVDEITVGLIRSRQHIRNYPMTCVVLITGPSLYFLRLWSKPPFVIWTGTSWRWYVICNLIPMIPVKEKYPRCHHLAVFHVEMQIPTITSPMVRSIIHSPCMRCVKTPTIIDNPRQTSWNLYKKKRKQYAR